MPSFPLETLTVTTSTRDEMIEVTDRVRMLVKQRQVSDGMVIVYVPHTTAAITINENAGPDVKHDMLLDKGTETGTGGVSVSSCQLTR